MPHPILTCRVCGKLVPVEEAHTDGYGRAVHEDCIASELADGARHTADAAANRDEAENT